MDNQTFLEPVLVLEASRNGSTLLMNILGSSPKFTFDKRYPFEYKYLTYFIQMSKVLSANRSKVDKAIWSASSINQENLSYVGPIPFDTKNLIRRNKLGIEVFKSNWASFSNYVKDKLSNDMSLPLFYAEKTPNLVAKYLDNCSIKYKKIHLLRDPRDAMLSMKSFNEKRGTYRFGWREGDDDLSFAKRYVQRIKSRMSHIAELLKHGTDPNEVIIRYEDLVCQPSSTLKYMSEFFDTKFDFIEDSELLQRHSTSASPRDSVLRWKKEMIPEVQAVFLDQLAKELLDTGYEV